MCIDVIVIDINDIVVFRMVDLFTLEGRTYLNPSARQQSAAPRLLPAARVGRLGSSAHATFSRILRTSSWLCRVRIAAVVVLTWIAPSAQGRDVSELERQDGPQYITIPTATQLTPAYRPFDPERYRAWSRSNADATSSRYSALDQINRDNVRELQLAWTYHSGPGYDSLEANPVIVDGVMYAPTISSSIVAVDAETGREKWRFSPEPEAGRQLENGWKPAFRGLIYWSGEPGHQAQLFFTTGAYLYSLDAKTGRPNPSFGRAGRVPAGSVVAPAIFRQIIVVAVWNVIQGFDLISGRLLWSFSTLPAATIEKVGHEDIGGNCWGGIAMDTDRGIVYAATGSPHPNMIGVIHLGQNQHADSVVALDAHTGKLMWSFQEIRHDVWDLDIPAPPNLVTVMHGGQRVDAVAQVTKMGNTLLLDRLTGQPLFPFRLRRAPAARLPGERMWPYQPNIELPEPFSKMDFTLDDVTHISPVAHDFVMRQLRNATYGWFPPFVLDRPNVFFGIGGGAEWTGAAFDPQTGWLYVSASHVPWMITVSRVERGEPSESTADIAGQKVFQATCAMCHGAWGAGQGHAPPLLNLATRLDEQTVGEIIEHGRNTMPPQSLTEEERTAVIRYLFHPVRSSASRKNRPVHGRPEYTFDGYPQLLDNQGYPGSQPPWGTLNAIDLNTGHIVWRVPLGEHEELTRQGIAKTGTYNYGGATVTAGGVVFCAGTMDEKIRAFDKSTGAELWSFKLPFGGYAPPATYEVHGRQYVVIAATGGGKPGTMRGDTYVAFTLPQSKEGTPK